MARLGFPMNASGYTSTEGPLLNTGRLIVIHPKRYDAFWAVVREPDCYPNGLLER